jgi:hypothetical protein
VKKKNADLQILDGVSVFDYGGTWDKPFTLNTPRESGTIDITLVYAFIGLLRRL